MTDTDHDITTAVNRSKLTDPRLEYVDCMVAATSCEQQNLWATLASDSRWRPADARVTYEWEQDTLGQWMQIGELAGYPICVSWSFAVVDGRVVCFYEPTSRVVDYEVVQAWARAICPSHTDAINFYLPKLETTPSSNVAKFQAARERIREGLRAWLEAERNKPPIPVDPDDSSLAAAGIPEIDEGTLIDRSRWMVPIDGETRRRIELPADLRGVSFTWSPKFGDEFAGLEPAKTIKTLHAYGAPGMFKPSIAEVLAQLPEDASAYVAFSIRGPETRDDLARFPTCLHAGYHVAEVTFYRKSEGE